MPASRLLSLALATSIGSILAVAEAAAQGGIACLPLTRGPDYSFEKVLDIAEAVPLGPLLPNDRGHALIPAVPADAASGLCLLRHRGSQTEPVVCTQSIDPTSPFSNLGDVDWNERGVIAVRGTLHASFPGSQTSHIQVIEPNGAIFALPTYYSHTPSGRKDYPAITREGDVFYRNEAGDLLLFDATLPGDDKSRRVINGQTIAITGVEPAVEGKLYFNATPNRVGTIQNALAPLPQGQSSAPFTTFEVEDAPFGVPTPSRFGAIVYFGETDIRKRFDVGGVDYVAGDPEFIIESPLAPGSEDAPINTFDAALAGPCKVALKGIARGLCDGGPSDGLVCDPDESPDPCFTGLGGPNDGYCRGPVQGVFVHQAGTYAAIARLGDPMLGSTVQGFSTLDGFPVFAGTNAGHIFFPVSLTDGRQLIVRAQGVGAAGAPALPTSCAGVSCRFGLEPQGWLGVSPNGVPLYFDPDIATGYDYTLDEGDPLFASVIVPEPLPNGDASFTLIVGEASFPLEAGEQFDLTQIDPLGVATFSIRGIDPGEELDPEDPMAFVTGATFMEEREANVTMTAVVPEPGATALGVAMLGALATLARRRRIARR